MEAKPYPEEKRRYLIDRGNEDFIAFLEQVEATKEGQRTLKSLLPSKVKGFRPGHAPLKRTVPILIIELKKEGELSNSSSRIWASFKNAWAAWVRSHDELNPILLELDNSADFDEKGECTALPNSELDIQCFKHLLEASENHLVDRETIERFYDYGYFLPSEEIEAFIKQACPRSEIELQRRLAALPEQVNELCETINLLSLQFSALESTDEAVHKLDERVTDTVRSLEAQHAKTESRVKKILGQLGKSINSIESRLSKVAELEKSEKSTQVAAAKFASRINEEIRQLGECIQASVDSLEVRIDTMDGTMSEIIAEREEQHQVTYQISATESNFTQMLSRLRRLIQSQLSRVEVRLNLMDQTIADINTERKTQLQSTNAPRVAYHAVQIGEQYRASLGKEKEHYENEDDYLEQFRSYLRRLGVTDCEETGSAIHVALKAFSALEIADTRMIETWQQVCGNHLHITKIDVEMGWIGLQDWFPNFLADECFEEKLERKDLDISIKKMLEIGDMPWAIHLSNYDRSFPESYLVGFLDWIGRFSDSGIRVFVTRCAGQNRCETNEDIYEWVACLPKPQVPEPIMDRNPRPPSAIVTSSEWKSWCQPNHAVHQDEFLNKLQEAVKNSGDQIPIVLFHEIQRYVQLSHGVLSPSKALDWSLTIRLLRWIAYRQEIIETVRNLIDQENCEFPRFQEELLQASEANE